MHSNNPQCIKRMNTCFGRQRSSPMMPRCICLAMGTLDVLPIPADSGLPLRASAGIAKSWPAAEPTLMMLCNGLIPATKLCTYVGTNFTVILIMCAYQHIENQNIRWRWNEPSLWWHSKIWRLFTIPVISGSRRYLKVCSSLWILSGCVCDLLWSSVMTSQPTIQMFNIHWRQSKRKGRRTPWGRIFQYDHNCL